MALAEHKPYSPLQPDGTQEFHDPSLRTVALLKKRVLIKDTDSGKELESQVDSLNELINAYRRGDIKEVY